MTTTSSKALATLALGALAATLLTGCNQGAPGVDDGGVGGPIDTESSGAGNPASATAGGEDSAFTAISMVENKGGKVVGLNRLDDGDPGYKVTVLDDNAFFEVHVDIAGKSPDQRTKTTSDATERDLLKDVVPLAEALKTARAELPGMNVAEAEITDDDDELQWRVELDLDQGQGTSEVFIDAESGELVK